MYLKKSFEYLKIRKIPTIKILIVRILMKQILHFSFSQELYSLIS